MKNIKADHHPNETVTGILEQNGLERYCQRLHP